MIDIGLLTTELLAAGLPVTGCAVLDLGSNTAGYSGATFYTRAEGIVKVDWVSANFPPTGPQNTSAANVVAAHNGVSAAINALRAQAAAVFADLNGDVQALAMAQRGLALVTLDEINTLRQWIAAFKVQVAAATTLADLKARVASLPAMPDRTVAQIKPAIRAKINAGTVDS